VAEAVLHPARGDPDRTAQALDNLVSNALQYGSLRGRARKGAEKRLQQVESGEADVRLELGCDRGKTLIPTAAA